MTIDDLAGLAEERPEDGDHGSGLDWLGLVAEAAREIQPDRHGDLVQTADTITAAAVAVIPGTEWAAITVVGQKDSTVRTLGPTGDVPVTLNQVQQRAGTGPCLTALWTEHVVQSNIADETRWPDYTTAAAQLGVTAVLSIRLYVRDEAKVLGALSLYTTRPEGFDADTAIVAEAYAAHAAIALDQLQQQSTLRKAIDTRDLIGQAKGILMERHRIRSEAAFQVLVTASQRTNRPLREVADVLVHTGELPS